MVQSSRSRALIALISGCDAPYNRCMCMPGGAGTSTTSKISARHRSHLPDHSNAQPDRHRRWCSHRGLGRSSRCFWAVSRSTIVACAYPVVLVPRQHRTSVTGIVHTSRTIQTRNQAVLTSDGRWCSHRGLMRRGLYSLGCFWLYNRCMCTYSGGSTQDPTTTRSRRRSHLSDRSTACRCTITKKR